MNNNSFPTILVIFGATGDLVEKKIFPALFSLYQKGLLPKLMKVIGFSHRELDQNGFIDHVCGILENHEAVDFDRSKQEHFLSMFLYNEGDFREISAFDDLASTLGRHDDEWQTCANKLFYLAVPPQYYEVIFDHLSESGLTEPCSPEEGWTRVLVEKPFGKDQPTAKRLDEKLGKLFDERQIYRIDHYLAKEMLQNILSFRFTNNLFEESWNNKFIEKITVRLLETLDVNNRGDFYDGVGALRDVGQNHLLQMIALTTMENPGGLTSDQIRRKRANILKHLKILSQEEIEKHTFRAQYEGYQHIEGVSPNSQTETFFKLVCELDHPRWRGVPVVVEAGKAMEEDLKEIVIEYKRSEPCFCIPEEENDYKNKVVFRLEPKEEITFDIWGKKPGMSSLSFKKQTFTLPYRNKSHVQYIEEYEKLLTDAIMGDQTLFVTTDEVSAMWEFIDPIAQGWEKDAVSLQTYKMHSNEVCHRSAAIGELTKLQVSIEKSIGIVGLGKMGANLARNLMDNGWGVVGYNRSEEVTKQLETEGLSGVLNLSEMIKKLPKPRIIWVMVPSGNPVDEVINSLSELLDKSDVVIDGGNTFYKDSIAHFNLLKDKGIEFVDVGVSGGPAGARNGACLMIGGNRRLYEHLLPLYTDIAVAGGHAYFEGAGAGHFVKMVHNGIEYGMMQSIAEGFDLLKHSDYQLHLDEIARIYNRGSVIESRLIKWMREAYLLFGDELSAVTGSAQFTGEGEWAVQEAKEKNVNMDAISLSLKARQESQKNPNYQGKIIQALRNQFGGHEI